MKTGLFIKSNSNFRAIVGVSLICALLFNSSPVKAGAYGNLDKAIGKIVLELDKNLPIDTSILFMDFQNLVGKTNPFCRYITQRLCVGLTKRAGRSIIDRQSMDTLFQEKKLHEIGLIDEKTAVSLGKTIGTKVVVYGTVAEFDKTISVVIRIMDIENGILKGGLTYDLKKTKSLKSLIASVNQFDIYSGDRVSPLEREVREIRMEAALKERMRNLNEQKSAPNVGNQISFSGQPGEAGSIPSHSPPPHDIKTIFNSLLR